MDLSLYLQLDQEISRLERLLEIPIEPYPRLTEELLFLLPESRVDPTPTTKRRRLQEKDMYVKLTILLLVVTFGICLKTVLTL